MASTIVGIDVGGTGLRAAKVKDDKLGKVITSGVSANEAADVVLNQLFALTDQLMQDGDVDAIGIGVPGIIDPKEGIVYNVRNIPSWKEVHLKNYMEARYHLPVLVNNNANCFALGEKYFGKGKDIESFIALLLGSGFGAGILIDGKLHSGRNCGAGEFGMMSYKDQNYEYYASGQFFRNCHNTSGYTIYDLAQTGDEKALKIFRELGTHIGRAIQTILYSYDVERIIMGGSVSIAYKFFKDEMWKEVSRLRFKKSLEHFELQISSLSSYDSIILGAAALFYDKMFRHLLLKNN